MLPIAAAAGCGLLFGIGLAIAQMTDPEKVKAFLDVAAIFDGTWDASLAFVMGAGLLVMVAFYRLGGRRDAPVLASAFVWPKRGDVDRQLVLGSTLFGVGWGLSGLCPGPAIAVLGLAPGEFALFVVAMLAGSWATGIALAARDGRFAGGNLPAT
ncbi:MAG: YeeE/YedE family protein [Bauldia sp.]|nr:YeeE/YedE family protein [Bauldia sp.]MCW5717180.1 YeeE/YedE family protein [Bauldia sp.]